MMQIIIRLAALTCALIAALIAGIIIGIGIASQARSQESWWDNNKVRACCSQADAVYADDWIIKPDGSALATVTGRGPRNHLWAPIGRTYAIPVERILREPGNPTGRPLLFLNAASLNLFCFAMGAMN